MARFKSITLALSLCAALAPGIALADDNNTGGTLAPAAATGPSRIADNHGHFVCTAAIRANGTVFSGEYVKVAQTLRLSAGTYQVAFTDPCPVVTIASGWFRIAQPDTLTTGTLPARSCTTADRGGVPSAVWVRCFNASGAPTDTPFTLHVSR